MTTTIRDNDQWIADISSTGAAQAAALDDLRVLLLRGLRKGIGGRAGNDENFLEDAVQDSLILIVQKIDQFAGRSQFVTWAVSIAVRTAISALRRKHWKDVSMSSLASDDGGAAAVEPVAEEAASVDADEERAKLLAAMKSAIETSLSEKQRTALLAEMHGMPMERIAEEMGSNRNAIYKLTHDARKKLKKTLEAAGYSQQDLTSAFAG